MMMNIVSGNVDLSGYKFYDMKDKPLKYPVVDKDKKVVIPAGATNVKIAFRQSHLNRWDTKTKTNIPLNVYVWNQPKSTASRSSMIIVHA